MMNSLRLADKASTVTVIEATIDRILTQPLSTVEVAKVNNGLLFSSRSRTDWLCIYNRAGMNTQSLRFMFGAS
jgi:hypothetical protein